MGLSYYPAFINLQGIKCVVVGGGKVAERKVVSLLRSGAAVTVVSPALTNALEKQKQRGRITHIERAYRKGDLKGAFLAIAATSEEETNRKISADAACLVNVVDRPAPANFIVPSVVGRGMLTVAVSTSGASPAMARAVRKEIELLYGRDFGRFLAFMKGMRRKALQQITDKKARRLFLKEVASEEVFPVLRERGFSAAREMALHRFQSTVAAQRSARTGEKIENKAGKKTGKKNSIADRR